VARELVESAAVAAADERWLAAFHRRDVAGLVELYTEDVVLLPDGEPAIVGRPAARAAHEAFFERWEARQEIDNTEIVVAGDWAFMRGSWLLTLEPRAGGDETRVRGKHLVIWRRQPDGAWKVARDIWNADAR
jgi:uncharacterized protein (TIGR02246 family)